MKHFFSLLLLGTLLSSLVPRLAGAQCNYIAVRSGKFSDASTWHVIAEHGTCASTPVSNGAAQITIIGFDVELDVPYVVGRFGTIRVENQGSLIGGTNLTIGDGTGNHNDTWLTVSSGSTLRVAQLQVDKATIVIGNPLNSTQPTSLITDCNLVLLNSVITDNGQALINGSVDVSRGAANNTLCGTGTLRIMGCVFGGNGALRQLASNCASTLVTNSCVQQVAPAGCPGPQAGNNTNQSACDALVSTCNPLPVELIIFTASLTSRQGVALHWVTASEKNSRLFAVERSANGQEFRQQQLVAAAGNSSLLINYDVVDEQPLPGTSYYRLRQLDADGTNTFSPARIIKTGTTNGESLAVYPGNSPQQWEVRSSLPADVLASGLASSIFVLDALGRAQRASVVADLAQPGHWQLDLRGLPTGIYIVRLVSATGSFSQRIQQ